MGTTGERIRRRCFAEGTPSLDSGLAPIALRCDKPQGHDGPHVGTQRVVLTWEWETALLHPTPEAEPTTHSDDSARS